MDITIETLKGLAVLVLRGKFTIDNSAEVRDALVKALEAGDAVSLDLMGVTEADVSFLQLVCSAHKTAREAGKELSLRGSSDAMWQAVEIAGFLHHRGCASALEPCVMTAAAAQEGMKP